MDSIVPLKQYRTYLQAWDIWLTVVVAEDGMYFVLRELCDALGIAQPRSQYEQLKAHESSEPFACKLRVKGERGGPQITYCINQEILGGWLFMVNPSKMRTEYRGRLVEFHRAARHALNRIVRGEVVGTLATSDSATQPAAIVHLSDWLGPPHSPIQLSTSEDEGE